MTNIYQQELRIYQQEVRAIASHMARLSGYTRELVTALDALPLRRALAGMEESVLRDVRVLAHRVENLR